MSEVRHTAAGQIGLRPVQPGDETFLFEVYSSIRAEELVMLDWTEHQKQTFLRMQFEAQSQQYRQNYPGAKFKIIVVNEQNAGRLYVHPRESEIRIMDIALLPPYRRLGVGTMLLRQILAQGEEAGKSVTIHVEVFNPARQLYERLGFKKAGENGPYQLMEWRPEVVTSTVKQACFAEQLAK